MIMPSWQLLCHHCISWRLPNSQYEQQLSATTSAATASKRHQHKLWKHQPESKSTITDSTNTSTSAHWGSAAFYSHDMESRSGSTASCCDPGASPVTTSHTIGTNCTKKPCSSPIYIVSAPQPTHLSWMGTAHIWRKSFLLQCHHQGVYLWTPCLPRIDTS